MEQQPPAGAPALLGEIVSIKARRPTRDSSFNHAMRLDPADYCLCQPLVDSAGVVVFVCGAIACAYVQLLEGEAVATTSYKVGCCSRSGGFMRWLGSEQEPYFPLALTGCRLPTDPRVFLFTFSVTATSYHAQQRFGLGSRPLFFVSASITTTLGRTCMFYTERFAVVARHGRECHRPDSALEQARPPELLDLGPVFAAPVLGEDMADPMLDDLLDDLQLPPQPNLSPELWLLLQAFERGEQWALDAVANMDLGRFLSDPS